jgi:hypothetical protein
LPSTIITIDENPAGIGATIGKIVAPMKTTLGGCISASCLLEVAANFLRIVQR